MELDFEDIRKLNVSTEGSFRNLSRFSYCGDSEILITENNHFAVLYDSHTLHPIKSWSFSLLSPLTHPLVYDELNQLIVSVQDSTIIRWPKEDEPQNGTKLKLSSKLYAVLPVRSFYPILVYFNGFCEILNKEFVSNFDESKSVIDKNEKIVFACTQFKENVLVLYLITQQSTEFTASNSQTFYEVLLDPKSLEFQVNSKKLIQLYSAFAICNNTCKLWGIKNAKKPELYSIQEERNENLDSTLTITKGMKFSKAGHLFLIGKRGANDVLEVWNFQFDAKVKIGSYLLPQTKPNDSDVVDNKLLITCEKEICIIPIKEKISLAETFKRIRKESLKNEKEDFSAYCNPLNCEALMKKLTQTNVVSTNSIIDILCACLDNISSSHIDQGKVQGLLQKVLLLPFNETKMIQSLKLKKDVSEKLVELLCCLTKSLDETNFRSSKDLKAKLLWITILVDAFFKQIIMNQTQELTDVFKNLSAKLDIFCRVYQDLEAIKDLIDMIKNKTLCLNASKFELAPQKTHYSFEFLEKSSFCKSYSCSITLND